MVDGGHFVAALTVDVAPKRRYLLLLVDEEENGPSRSCRPIRLSANCQRLTPPAKPRKRRPSRDRLRSHGKGEAAPPRSLDGARPPPSALHWLTVSDRYLGGRATPLSEGGAHGDPAPCCPKHLLGCEVGGRAGEAMVGDTWRRFNCPRRCLETVGLERGRVTSTQFR